MTLKDLFEYISLHPEYILIYLIGLPFLAVFVGLLSHRSGDKSPYKELFMVIVYAVTIPGVFAFLLNIYFFLFESKSIMDYNIYLQILPVVSMIICLKIIRNYVSFDAIPGFDKLSGFMIIIAALIVFMWVLDRFRFLAIVRIPFYYLVILMIVLLLAINYGFKKLKK